MKCDKCDKDYNWFEMTKIERIDQTPNCGGLLVGRYPEPKYVCDNCLNKSKNKLNNP